MLSQHAEPIGFQVAFVLFSDRMKESDRFGLKSAFGDFQQDSEQVRRP